LGASSPSALLGNSGLSEGLNIIFGTWIYDHDHSLSTMRCAMDIDRVVGGDDDALYCSVFLDASIETTKWMTGIVQPGCRLCYGMGASVKVKVNEFSRISMYDFWRET